jgi:glycosyltransferase involved in cell wall biosynthesis
MGWKNSFTGISSSFNMDISVVIPAYNEQDNVVSLYQELSQVLQAYDRECEFIFVDDGSADQTFHQLKSLHQTDNRLKVIRFKKNFGQSAALSAGFARAKGEVVITMDADLQNDPRDIPRLVQELENGYDVVSGWRHSRKDSFFKRMFSRFSNWLRSKLTLESIHDSGCTLRAYRSECLHDLELYGEMHRYIPALLSWKGYKIGEVKVAHRPRVHGKTKYSWRRLAKGFLDLLLVTFWQRFSFRPIHVFGGLGLVSALIGFALAIYLLVCRVFFDMALADRPLFLLAILMIIVGVQFIVFGVLADIMLRVYYRQSDKRNYIIEEVIE